MRIITVRSMLLVAAFISAGLTASVQGQETKSKVKPLATPPPVLSGAEIISRADDYREEPASKEPEKTAKPATPTSTLVKDLSDRLKKLEESQKSTYDEKQKRLLLNLDILSRAEQRSEGLRKQLFEMVEKENALKLRLDQIEIEMRPEVIERSLQLAGSLRPEDVRDARRKSLGAERANLQALLNQVQTTRASIDLSLQRSDQLVDKLRVKLEKDIEDALKDDTED